MTCLDEYRDSEISRRLVGRIARIATRPWVLMNFCGIQSHTLSGYGIADMLPSGIELIQGPGSPVRVTPLSRIDRAIGIARLPGVTFTLQGEMLRVPGTHSDLHSARALGADVRVVYSPGDALNIARENPRRQVVFFGLGFETSALASAMAVWRARREGIGNFSMLVSHLLLPPAMRLIVQSNASRVQGFIAPGHICTLAGRGEYCRLTREFHVPVVMAGIHPMDSLEAIFLLVAQLEQGRADVEEQYCRSVDYDGNPAMQDVMNDVFEVADLEWRGLGLVAGSGLRLRAEYADYDAEKSFNLEPRTPVGRPALRARREKAMAMSAFCNAAEDY